uniref:Uncharacterized protein n=1 Tax=Timema poppense TaxID=170557 RepID=A0A7R9DTH2_TIMPO|nr:unnamed protein product [Timema poppensis]
MKAAVLAVKVEHRPIRGAAQDFGTPFRTLARYCAKHSPAAQPVEATPASLPWARSSYAKPWKVRVATLNVVKMGGGGVECTTCARRAHEDCIPGDSVFYM